MPDLFYLLSKWWKQMLLIVVLSLAIVATTLYLRPAKYLSVSTALPASSYSADKASIFNSNIQLLYPSLGTPEDVDMIVGTAQLDTVYIAVAEEFNLPDHYKTEEKGRAAILKAAYLLKANTKVIKSDFSELKVKTWDKDNILASQLANAITDKLQAIHQDLQNSNNISTLKSLQSGKEKIQAQIDSITIFLQHSDIPTEHAEGYTSRRVALSEQLQQYEKLISQYQLMVDNKPPVLIIVEKARPASWPDKPEKLPILTATFVLSFLFALALALYLEKRKAVYP
ncbi:MAG: hypothetical protein Q8941_11740 [Bacteroidota bacterium]|nr:hypothetical protein [Bacteroidota bacterium]